MKFRAYFCKICPKISGKFANYMELYYDIKGKDLLSNALTIVSGRHKFNDSLDRKSVV